jgi:hypothetical protein
MAKVKASGETQQGESGMTEYVVFGTLLIAELTNALQR